MLRDSRPEDSLQVTAVHDQGQFAQHAADLTLRPVNEPAAMPGEVLNAYCIDGQADAVNQRITDALTEPKPGPWDEGKAGSEPAA